MAQIADLLIAIKADVDDFHKAMATSRESLSLLGNTAVTAGRTVRRAGLMMTAAAGIAAAGMGALVNHARGVSSAFREVSTLMDRSQNAANIFGDEVRRLSTEFAVQGGQVQAIQGLYQTLSASITDTQKAVKFMETSLKTATVGMTDMETAVDVLSTAVNAYGKDATFAKEASNILFTTVQRGKVRFEELARSIGPLIVFAAQFGVRLEEAAAGMALLTRRGFTARRAAMALRSTIRRFMKPTKEMEEILGNIAEEYDLLEGEAKEAKETFDAQKQELERLRDALNGGSQKLQDMKADLQAENEELNRLQMELQETEAELEGLKGQFDDLSDSMRDNRIRIKEIRLAARKEGRELTEQEKEEIDELKLANEELRLQQMKTERTMDNVREKRSEQRDQVREQKKEVSEQEDQIESFEQKLRDQISAQEKKVEKARDNWESYRKTLGMTLLEKEGLIGAIKAIKDGAEDLNIPMTEAINNQRALQAIFPLLSNDAEKFNEDLAAMEDAGGTVTEQFGRFRESFGFKFRQSLNELKATFNDVGQVLKQNIAPLLDDVNGIVTTLSDKFNNLPKGMKQAIAQFALLATALGLVLGPLLIIAGQVAILAGALGGAGLAAAVGIAAIAVGALAGGFQILKEDGEGSKQVIQDMKKLLDDLIGAAQWAKEVFVEELLPGIQEFAKGVSSVIMEVADAIGFMVEQSGAGKGDIRTLASLLGDLLGFIGQWLQDNKKLVASIVLFVGIIGTVIKVISIVSSAVAGASAAIGALSGVISAVAGVLGTMVAVLGGPITILVLLIAGLAAAWATNLFGIRDKTRTAVDAVTGFFSDIIQGAKDLWNGTVQWFNNTIEAVENFVEQNKRWFSLLGGILLILVTGPIGIALLLFKNNVFGVRDAVENFVDKSIAWLDKWGTKFKKGFNKAKDIILDWKHMFMGALAPILEHFNIFISDIKAAIEEELSKIDQWLDENLVSPIESLIDDALSWGENLVSALAQGIRNEIDKVAQATEDIAMEMEKYIGIFSDADKGPLSDLTKWGPNLIKTFVKGIKDNLDLVGGVLKDMGIPVDEMANQMQGAAGVMAGGGKTINVNEKAIYFAPGAFQGVSDDELPEMVREEVDESLEDIVDDMEGQGR